MLATMIVQNQNSSLAFDGANNYNLMQESPHVSTGQGMPKSRQALAKEVIQSPPLSEPASSRLFSPIKTNTEPAWMADKRLTRSKVFMARFHKAATVLQKYTRRWFQRDGLVAAQQNRAVTVVQAVVRGVLHRKLVVQILAAQRIQSLARGWRARRWHRVTVLEQQLLQIERQRLNDLEEIEAWKDRQKQLILEEYAREKREMEGRMEQLKHANAAIASIRRSNKKIRAENTKLAEAILYLTKENQALEKTLKKINKQRKDCQQKVQELETKIPQYVNVLKEIVDRKRKYKTAILDRKDFFKFEHQCRHIFLDTVSEMLRHIHDQCKDQKLVELVTNIALDGTEPYEK